MSSSQDSFLRAARRLVSLRSNTTVDRSRREGIALTSLACGILSVAILAPNYCDSAEPAVLRAGQTLSSTQRAGESVSYVFHATTGQTYLVVLEQEGLDFIVEVTGPEGVERSFNSPLRRDGREVVLLEDPEEGEHTIKVISNEWTATVGRHEITLFTSEFTPPTPSLDSAGLKLMSDASESFARSSGLAGAQRDEAVATAQRLYELAVRHWESAKGGGVFSADAKYSVAFMQYYFRSQYRLAQDLAGEAYEAYLDYGDQLSGGGAKILAAAALMETMSNAEAESDRVLQESLHLLQEAQSIYEKFGNEYQLALTNRYRGLAHYYFGSLDLARDFWQQAVAQLDAEGETSGMLDVRSMLAMADVEDGHLRAAATALEEIARVSENWAGTVGKNFRARVLDDLGSAHRIQGDIDDALRAFSEALRLHAELVDPHGLAYSRSGLGLTFFDAGEFELATNYAEAAIAGAQPGQTAVLSQSLVVLGDIEYLRGNYAQALEHHSDALSISPEEGAVRAHGKVLVARDKTALGRYPEARQDATEALRLAVAANSPRWVADARFAIADTHIHEADLHSAIPMLTEVLAEYQRLGLYDEQAQVLHELAIAARGQNRWEEAIAHGRDLIELLDTSRSRVSAPELRAFHAARRRNYYEFQINALMDRAGSSSDQSGDFIGEALEVSEKSRARMTLDLLTEASVDLGAGINGEDAARRTRLLDELSSLSYQRDTLIEQGGLTERDSEELSELVDAMESVQSELYILETAVRTDANESRGLVNASTLTAEEIQRQLDNGTTLIQYFLGDSRSFAWVVNKDSINAVALPPRQRIERVAQSVYASLEARGSLRAQTEQLAALAELVFTPLRRFLVDESTIVIAADGALQYIPFAAMPLDDSGTRLLSSYRVLNTHSVSAVSAQRARATSSGATRMLAVFADPVFNREDPRIVGLDQVDARVPAPVAWATRSSMTRQCTTDECTQPEETSGRSFARLGWTGREGQAIAALDPTGEPLILEGFYARRERALAKELGEYRYIHFATHGLLDSRFPALSALILSQYDETGQYQDGVLRLNDIYGMQLNAELVVLSACETALGEEIRGEGLIGLTQGFMYAGAKSIVASLWEVSDRATSELMSRFYGFMFGDGKEPSEALRLAQLSMAEERRFADPYLWSGFIVLGDWQ